ncbi:ATP phosphoribosyltransferase regulatory subunit [Thiocystis violascens]|uniref:ATP phosphoribosyltransferase regulatory subunit n=1 Tax=Thiocystis violascens (strain ATCC 17096 / DSM 198 / 6111) TaxID=765911 RepID=I3Y666_THIV6|nr:ATP phosphoribosyltransferase regulatory subunit [Thiocystis violascens]AFL72484.1 ATP phosphoribosyltransferase, regulatory subunit [Thiocystis violascens DSM 198]
MTATNEERWLLPAGIEEVLPPQARIMEFLRRELLDLYASWGYELVIPPFIDYLESLLTGTGQDLDLQTFKLTDQLTGRLLGVRADMTPQVARMDAHHLRRDAPTRLCYLGTVLHTRADGFGGTRSPLQIGAEIYGHSGIESDTEILRLILLTLRAAGIAESYLDLGHVGIFRGLARQAGLDANQEHALFGALQRKAIPEIESLIGGFGVTGAPARMLIALAELNGSDALTRADALLSAADRPVREAVDYLRRLADELNRWHPEVSVHYDLAELRGYHYKTGSVFAAFVPGWGLEVARGGRYDDIGRVFGRARPAVGFSTDLKSLLQHGQGLEQRYRETDPVYAPWSADPALRETVERLRASGERVINALPGQQQDPRQLGCRRMLAERDGRWELQTLGKVDSPSFDNQ